MSLSSGDMFRYSNVGENTSSNHGSKSVQGSIDCISSGSLIRTRFMSGASSEGSRGNTELMDEDIPYYRSFDGSSMIASDSE